jgi:hypothetical protein
VGHDHHAIRHPTRDRVVADGCFTENF